MLIQKVSSTVSSKAVKIAHQTLSRKWSLVYSKILASVSIRRSPHWWLTKRYVYNPGSLLRHSASSSLLTHLEPVSNIQNAPQSKSHHAQVGHHSKHQASHQSSNPPTKESHYIKPPSDYHYEGTSNDKRTSHYSSNRGSIEVAGGRRESVDNGRKSTEEENKYYHQSPLRRPSKSQHQQANHNSISSKKVDKENLGRESHAYVSESKEKKEEKEKIHNLISDVKNVLYPIKKQPVKPDGHCSDEDFEEDADKRVYAKYYCLLSLLF